MTTSRTVYADTATGEVHSATELLWPEPIPRIQANVTDTPVPGKAPNRARGFLNLAVVLFKYHPEHQ